MTSEIIPVFCNEKEMANYAYIIKDTASDAAIIIDAAEPTPIIAELTRRNLTPSYILTTHHHFDHVGGNIELKQKYNLKIIAPEKEFTQVPGADIPATANSDIKIGNLEFSVIDAPGHTHGHVLYHLIASKALFTGDTLFNLCIGGLFEGTPEQMFSTLMKIKSLPENTLIFPGHEYTRSCLPKQLPDTPEFNTYLQKMRLREQRKTAPSTLAEEKKFNPYLRANTLAEFIGG